MSSKECETQLNELLEAWDLDEATLNQTDIEAIKHLLLENQIQQDVIISYKTTNLDQAVVIQQLEQENQKYKEVIDKLKEWINIVQQNKDNKHLEPFISTDELDELLDILKKGSE